MLAAAILTARSPYGSLQVMPYGSHIHLQENSMATDLGQIQRELEEEIRQLELEKAGYDARLEEKRRLLSRLRVDEAPPQPEPVPVVEAPAQPAPVAIAASSGRVSITDLGQAPLRGGTANASRTRATCWTTSTFPTTSPRNTPRRAMQPLARYSGGQDAALSWPLRLTWCWQTAPV